MSSNKRSKGKNIESNPAPEPAPAQQPEEGYRQTMHLGLYTVDIADLDVIVEDLRRGPVGRLRGKIGREQAARHAIAETAKRLRAESLRAMR